VKSFIDTALSVVYVSNLAPDGPAARSGVKMGDVITHWNDRPISTKNDAIEAAAQVKVGSTVSLHCARKDPTDPFKSYSVVCKCTAEKASFGKPHIGLDVTGQTQSVVTVTAVESDSPAALGGVKVGDIITTWNRFPVNTLGDLDNLRSTAVPGQLVSLAMLRPGMGSNDVGVPVTCRILLGGRASSSSSSNSAN